MTNHAATARAHAFLVDSDGAAVGKSASLGAPELSPNFDCLTAIPTEHAAAFSLLDQSAGKLVWRLAELSAAGKLLR